MNQAFEQVRQAEEQAQRRLSLAQQKADALKKETTARIKAMQEDYAGQLREFQCRLEQLEQESIQSEASRLEADWDTERDRMRRAYRTLREEMLPILAGKVIKPHGHSGN